MLCDTEFRQILDVSTSQPGALHQHVSLVLRWFTFQVIHHMHLVNVGSKHVYLRSRKTKGKDTIRKTKDSIRTAVNDYFQ